MTGMVSRLCLFVSLFVDRMEGTGTDATDARDLDKAKSLLRTDGRMLEGRPLIAIFWRKIHRVFCHRFNCYE
jgi:hypothetical protein